MNMVCMVRCCRSLCTNDHTRVSFHIFRHKLNALCLSGICCKSPCICVHFQEQHHNDAGRAMLKVFDDIKLFLYVHKARCTGFSFNIVGALRYFYTIHMFQNICAYSLRIYFHKVVSIGRFRVVSCRVLNLHDHNLELALSSFYIALAAILGAFSLKRMKKFASHCA